MQNYIELDEAKLRELWPDTRLSVSHIAIVLKTSRKTILKKANRLGLPPKKHSPYDRKLLRRLWLFTTMTPQEIAFELGSSRQFVCLQAKEMGLPKKVPERRQSKRDPTRKEILKRAAECRKRHLEKKRKEPYQREDEGSALRCFSHCGDCYVSAGLLS